MKKNGAALISLKGLSKVYKTGSVSVHALQNVTIDIQPGDYVAVMGPSGSGKTTLMNLLGCLDRPTSGTYLFEGDDVGKMSDNDLAGIRNRKVGFVFQTYNLLPRLTAIANVRVPALYGDRANLKRAAGLLREVGLANRGHHRPTQLSGGQQQRVAIARALINEPALILADEPTGNLDSKSGREIIAIFRRLHRRGITILMVTHNQELARQAGRIVTFHDGRIVSDQKT